MDVFGSWMDHDLYVSGSGSKITWGKKTLPSLSFFVFNCPQQRLESVIKVIEVFYDQDTNFCFVTIDFVCSVWSVKKKKCVLYVANNIPIFLVSAFGQYQSDVGTVYILATSGSRLS